MSSAQRQISTRTTSKRYRPPGAPASWALLSLKGTLRPQLPQEDPASAHFPLVQGHTATQEHPSQALPGTGTKTETAPRLGGLKHSQSKPGSGP